MPLWRHSKVKSRRPPPPVCCCWEIEKSSRTFTFDLVLTLSSPLHPRFIDFPVASPASPTVRLCNYDLLIPFRWPELLVVPISSLPSSSSSPSSATTGTTPRLSALWVSDCHWFVVSLFDVKRGLRSLSLISALLALGAKENGIAVLPVAITWDIFIIHSGGDAGGTGGKLNK